MGNLLMVMTLWQFNRANDPFMAIYGYGLWPIYRWFTMFTY